MYQNNIFLPGYAEQAQQAGATHCFGQQLISFHNPGKCIHVPTERWQKQGQREPTD